MYGESHDRAASGSQQRSVNEIYALTTECDQLKRQLEAATRERDAFADQLEMMQTKLDSFMNQTLVTALARMATRHEALRLLNDQLQWKVSELNGTISEMAAQIEALKNRPLAVQVKELEATTKFTQQCAARMKIEFDKQRQQLVEEVQTWTRRAQQAEAREINNKALSNIQDTAAVEAIVNFEQLAITTTAAIEAASVATLVPAIEDFTLINAAVNACEE